jgi:F-type H+-transporting ATPase subunit delta
MREPTVARNYAEALVAVAERHDAVDRYGRLIDLLAGAVEVEPKLQLALESPRVKRNVKQRVLERALRGVAPGPFIRFLEAVVQRGRQGLLREIATQYQLLVDEHLHRVHAGVVTAHAMEPALRTELQAVLSRAVGREVVPHFRTDPTILGGLLVRVGDRVFDGSVRRRLNALRFRLLGAAP